MNTYVKLLASILIDLAGFFTAGFGEIADLIWAPISALLIWKLYHRDAYTFIGFTEEILPGFDIVPTATLAWLDEKGVFKLFK